MVATYLTRRNGRYHFRMRVPQDLLSVINTREIHRSLGTTDGRTAKALATTLRVKLKSEFAQLRQQAILNSRLIQGPNGQNQPIPSLAQSMIQPTNMTNQEPDQGPDLAGLIDAFIEERGKLWAPRSTQVHIGALRLFQEFVGPKAIGLLSRKDCKEFKLTLEKLPPKWQTRFKSMKVRDVAALGLPPIRPATVNRMLSPICTFLNWAVVEGYISANPASRLRAIDRVRADTQRSTFSADDLHSLFEKSPMYKGCDEAWKRNHPGSKIIKDARFKETIVSGHERLWPEFQRNKNGSYSASYSLWFGRYKRLIGLTDRKKTFHSFRHTFIDRLKQLDVPDGKIQELVGHANHSITTGRYGKPYRPNTLREVIEALGYGLDLRELHMEKWTTE